MVSATYHGPLSTFLATHDPFNEDSGEMTPMARYIKGDFIELSLWDFAGIP